MGQAKRRGSQQERIQQALQTVSKDERIRRSRQEFYSMSQSELKDAYNNTPAQKAINERKTK